MDTGCCHGEDEFLHHQHHTLQLSSVSMSVCEPSKTARVWNRTEKPVGAIRSGLTVDCCVQVALGYWPLGPKRSWFGRVYTTYCCTEAPKYFGLRVITEEGAVFDPQKPYVVGEVSNILRFVEEGGGAGGAAALHAACDANKPLLGTGRTHCSCSVHG